MADQTPINEFEAPQPAAEKPAEKPAEQPPTKTKAETDFEQRMQDLGSKAVDLQQREEKVAKFEKLGLDLGKLERLADKLPGLAAALDAEDPDVEVARALYGDRLNLTTLTKLANLPEVLAPKVLTVEERVQRTLAEAKAKEVADKLAADQLAATKKAEDDRKAAEAAQAKLDQETGEYLKEAKAFVKANAARFPLFLAFDEQNDHEQMIVDIINDHLVESRKAGKPEILEIDQAIQKIEDRYLATIHKTPFAPRSRKEPTFEDELEAMARQAAVPRSPKARELTLDEQIVADLRAADAAAVQQQRRFPR
jgi:hypothetical protein